MSDNSELPHSFDAEVWAKEFVKTLQENPELEIDESLMISWFANALMAGYDRGKTQLAKLITKDWTKGQLVQIVECLDDGSFVVRVLNPLLAEGLAQPAALQLGYPNGHLIVQASELEIKESALPDLSQLLTHRQVWSLKVHLEFLGWNPIFSGQVKKGDLEMDWVDAIKHELELARRM